MQQSVSTNPGEVDRILAGGGEAGALSRSVDWSKTALGPVEGWSQALRSAAALVLHNHSGMLLWWGKEFVQIYNDAYRPVLGDKHPRAMGQPFSECWKEVFHIVGPMAERPFLGGPASTSDDLPLLINRRVHREETHFRLAYSAVPDETVPVTGIGGVLATVTEITEQAYGERQLRTLSELAARAAAEGQTTDQACVSAVATLQQDHWDVPFALLYLLDAGGGRAHLIASAGFDRVDGGYSGAREVDFSVGSPGSGAWQWPLAEVARERRIVTVDDLSPCPIALPASPWSDRPGSAIVLPLASPGQASAYGVLVCGVSPHRVLDTGYRTFFELVAGQVATAIRNAQALEQERKRAEALAEIDRAKTAFFSNVSHEFRTPLTLMLGPQQDALDSPEGVLRGENLRAAYRNTLRLLKLVNSLLEFSRNEAGRAKVWYLPTDLAVSTKDLASTFRSAIERGGLRFEVDCPPLPEPVYVDRDMWERIVLNLLSNAFKFTLTGAITVVQRIVGRALVLSVTDTGVGIAESELRRVFERFHRIEGTRARTHEGSGIGLALVRDMVALHGGRIDVSSRVGVGTTFEVSLPLGSAHLPEDRIGAASTFAGTRGSADAFVEEAMRWLPEPAVTSRPEEGSARPAATPGSARVLVVDDNADMREYVVRLLRPHWTVEVAGDGVQALEQVLKAPPDLILTDVMMPNLDGFGLVRALRDEPRTAQIPIIMLSARAGEESRVDGLVAGADDYLVKPFSAKELVARVRVHLENGALRRAAEEQAERLATANAEAERARAAAESANRTKDEFLAMLGHELRNPLSPIVTALQLMRMRGADHREQAVIERQVAHLIRLVDDLLDISRITRGKIELRRSRTELAPVVLRGLETAGPLLEQRRQKVDLQVAAEGLEVEVDPDRLAQVVANLLTNAAKYSEPGTVVHLVAARVEGRVRLSVRDEGIGIEGGMLGRVFDVFFQEQQSLDRSKGGLGLGLAIVRSLVELHGGTVRAESEGLGRGSEFVVDLPPAPGAEAPLVFAAAGKIQALSFAGDASPRSKKRILVVDDNTDAAESVAELLEVLGNEVQMAHDGAEALRVASLFQPDLCLIDIGLPVMDGYELAKQLRASNALGAGVRLIAVTGYGQDADRKRSRDAGFDAHLVKPVSADVLSRTVAN